MCVCTSIYMSGWVFMCGCVRMCVYIDIHVWVCVHVCGCVRMCVYSDIHVWMGVHVWVGVHVCVFGGGSGPHSERCRTVVIARRRAVCSQLNFSNNNPNIKHLKIRKTPDWEYGSISATIATWPQATKQLAWHWRQLVVGSGAVGWACFTDVAALGNILLEQFMFVGVCLRGRRAGLL